MYSGGGTRLRSGRAWGEAAAVRGGKRRGDEDWTGLHLAVDGGCDGGRLLSGILHRQRVGCRHDGRPLAEMKLREVEALVVAGSFLKHSEMLRRERGEGRKTAEAARKSTRDALSSSSHKPLRAHEMMWMPK